MHEQIYYLRSSRTASLLCGCECRSQSSQSAVRQYNICMLLDFCLKMSIDQSPSPCASVMDSMRFVLMTLEIWFSILHWSSLGTCYLSSHCSGGRLVIFSCGLKSRSRGVSFPAKKKTNWQEDGEIKDAAQKHDGFTPKCSYQYVKVLVSQKLLEKSSAGSVSRSSHVTIIWNITPRIPSTYRSSVCVGHISRKACHDYTLHVLLYRNVSSYLKCFSSI